MVYKYNLYLKMMREDAFKLQERLKKKARYQSQLSNFIFWPSVSWLTVYFNHWSLIGQLILKLMSKSPLLTLNTEVEEDTSNGVSDKIPAHIIREKLNLVEPPDFSLPCKISLIRTSLNDQWVNYIHLRWTGSEIKDVLDFLVIRPFIPNLDK